MAGLQAQTSLKGKETENKREEEDQVLLARSCKARRVQCNRDAGDGGCSAGTSGRRTADMDFSPPSALWGFTSEGVFVPGASQIPAKSELGTRFWELRNTMVAPGHVSHPSGTSLQWEPTNHRIQPPHPTIASSHRIQPPRPTVASNHHMQPQRPTTASCPDLAPV